MGSLFINYGVKAGGGPPFLKRSRTAVSQLQTRTRTGTSSSQLQKRQRYCGGSRVTNYVWGIAWVNECYDNGSRYVDRCNFGRSCGGGGYSGNCYEPDNYLCDIFGCSGAYEGCMAYRDCYPESSYSCSWGGFSGWANVTSCSPSNGACFSNCCSCSFSPNVQCRTLTTCNWGNYSAWSNVSSCTPSSPTCGTERQCQTIYQWNDWSEWEEAEVCVSQSPALGAGAVEIECQAI